MNRIVALIDYLKVTHPELISALTEVKLVPGTTVPCFEIPVEGSLEQEIKGFLKGFDIGSKEGKEYISKEFFTSYKSILENAFYAGGQQGYHEGFEDGFDSGFEKGEDAGFCNENLNSLIPSDAFDVEVFSIQPSSDFSTGLQAFVGYKTEVEEGKSDFHFIQVQFAAGTPQKQIN